MRIQPMIALLAIICAYAHPHMFIDTEMEVRLQGSTLEGLGITWYFDPMFTAAIITDFDADRNGVFNTSETAAVYENAFSNLESSDYFTFVEIGGDILSPSCTTEFEVYVQDGQLVYSFFCPFDTEVHEGSFKVAIYDETFYCDILYCPGEPVSITGNPEASYRILQNEDISISYGGTVSVSRDGASYTGTAYPQQLVVFIN